MRPSFTVGHHLSPWFYNGHFLPLQITLNTLAQTSFLLLHYPVAQDLSFISCFHADYFSDFNVCQNLILLKLCKFILFSFWSTPQSNPCSNNTSHSLRPVRVSIGSSSPQNDFCFRLLPESYKILEVLLEIPLFYDFSVLHQYPSSLKFYWMSNKHIYT